MMTLLNTLSPVKKAHFMKWHTEGNLLLLGAGMDYLESTIKVLNDARVDWKSVSKPVTRADVNGSDKRIYIFSNGVEEFVIVSADTMTSDKKHLTVYVVK